MMFSGHFTRLKTILPCELLEEDKALRWGITCFLFHVITQLIRTVMCRRQ